MRVAVFGCGYWAAFQVAGWQALGVEAAAVWNRTESRAHTFAERFHIPRVFSTPEEVFQWGEFDIADIIADAPAHEMLTLLAAEYGKPVICQKPMALTLEACRRMGTDPGTTAFVGDQLFTDVLGANRHGLMSIVVHPMELKNPFYILRYIVECPFRALAKKAGEE